VARTVLVDCSHPWRSWRLVIERFGDSRLLMAVMKTRHWLFWRFTVTHRGYEAPSLNILVVHGHSWRSWSLVIDCFGSSRSLMTVMKTRHWTFWRFTVTHGGYEDSSLNVLAVHGHL